MEKAEFIDGSVLGLLCETPGPLQFDELTRFYPDKIELEDSVGRLARHGLVHRTETKFIMPSVSGRFAYAIQQGT